MTTSGKFTAAIDATAKAVDRANELAVYVTAAKAAACAAGRVNVLAGAHLTDRDVFKQVKKSVIEAVATYREAAKIAANKTSDLALIAHDVATALDAAAKVANEVVEVANAISENYWECSNDHC